MYKMNRSGFARGLGVAWDTANNAVLAEGKRRRGSISVLPHFSQVISTAASLMTIIRGVRSVRRLHRTGRTRHMDERALDAPVCGIPYVTSCDVMVTVGSRQSLRELGP